MPCIAAAARRLTIDGVSTRDRGPLRNNSRVAGEGFRLVWRSLNEIEGERCTMRSVNRRVQIGHHDAFIVQFAMVNLQFAMLSDQLGFPVIQ